LFVPLYKGSVGMPDIHWWVSFMPCRNFGPDTPSGKFTRASVFACRDPQIPEWWAPRWRWRFDGQNLIRGIDDMPRAEFDVVDSEVRL
jgi:hypothetical protein